MFSLFSLIARLLRPAAIQNPADPAAVLMERADSCLGQDPRHAEELRQAARAWLSVVR